MADIDDNTKNFIDQLSSGNNVDAGEAFKDALRAKVASSLDNARKDVAANIFNGDALSHSDPKPVIADVGTFNQDGSISSTGDGQAQIDLSQDGTADTMVGVDVNAGE
jgi:hypothetical protein|tara:strand:- start:415 stop:738 length:324 start_codon:yes stop_codon:yes gene_type:complete